MSLISFRCPAFWFIALILSSLQKLLLEANTHDGARKVGPQEKSIAYSWPYLGASFVTAGSIRGASFVTADLIRELVLLQLALSGS